MSLRNCHITRRILHDVSARYQTDSTSGFGLSSIVDPSNAEGKSSMISGRTDSENGQGELTTELRQPFDLLEKTIAAAQTKKATELSFDGFSEIWLPGQDSNLRQGG